MLFEPKQKSRYQKNTETPSWFNFTRIYQYLAQVFNTILWNERIANQVFDAFFEVVAFTYFLLRYFILYDILLH